MLYLGHNISCTQYFNRGSQRQGKSRKEESNDLKIKIINSAEPTHGD